MAQDQVTAKSAKGKGSLSRRWKRIKETWGAFLFLARGGSLAVRLEWDDPLIGVKIFNLRPGATLKVDREAAFAKKCIVDMLRARGFDAASPGDPDAFLVKWRQYSSESE